MRPFLAAFLAMALAGCSSSSSSTPDSSAGAGASGGTTGGAGGTGGGGVCVAGDLAPCFCANAESGEFACKADGSGYGTCFCASSGGCPAGEVPACACPGPSGQQNVCACPGPPVMKEPGALVCATPGDLMPCASLCGATGSGGAGGQSAGGSGGAAGSKPMVCVPGASVACTGPAGCKGGQACLADGSGYAACDCGSGGAGGGGAAGQGGGGGLGGAGAAGGSGGAAGSGGSPAGSAGSSGSAGSAGAFVPVFGTDFEDCSDTAAGNKGCQGIPADTRCIGWYTAQSTAQQMNAWAMVHCKAVTTQGNSSSACCPP